MTATTYTIHDARNHEVVAKAYTGTLATVAKTLATQVDALTTRRFYVHNGVGIVAAFLTRNGDAHEILRDDFMKFDTPARAAREAAGFENFDR